MDMTRIKEIWIIKTIPIRSVKNTIISIISFSIISPIHTKPPN